MKYLILLLLSFALTAGAQTPAQQDSVHRAYHLMRKKDPKQNNPYAFADSAKAKKAAGKLKKQSNVNDKATYWSGFVTPSFEHWISNPFNKKHSIKEACS